MRRIVGFSAACLGFIALIMLTVWIMGAFEGTNLGFHGWIAMTLGMTVTSVLGVVLMALVFHSDRSGQDESAGTAGTSRAGERSLAVQLGGGPEPRWGLDSAMTSRVGMFDDKANALGIEGIGELGVCCTGAAVIQRRSERHRRAGLRLSSNDGKAAARTACRSADDQDRLMTEPPDPEAGCALDLSTAMVGPRSTPSRCAFLTTANALPSFTEPNSACRAMARSKVAAGSPARHSSPDQG